MTLPWSKIYTDLLYLSPEPQLLQRFSPQRLSVTRAFVPPQTAREEPKHLLRFPPSDHNGDDDGDRRYYDCYDHLRAKAILAVIAVCGFA